MTVKEIISNKEESGFSSGYSMDLYYHTGEDIEEMLQEYAKLKCKELLLLVAKKALIREIYVSPVNGVETSRLSYAFGGENTDYSIDKDSIINAVDLETFIV